MIEVIVSIAITGVLVYSIGGSISYVHRMNSASEGKEKALAFAKQSMEIVTGIKNDQFACKCSVDNCVGDLCTRTQDNQPCTLLNNFSSCWTEFPVGLTNNEPLHLEYSSTQGRWYLAFGIETVSDDDSYTREIKLENIQRDINGNIVESGGSEDTNTKKVTVTMNWTERSEQHDLSITTILTGWENLNEEAQP